jgi:hypothetical protein
VCDIALGFYIAFALATRNLYSLVQSLLASGNPVTTKSQRTTLRLTLPAVMLAVILPLLRTVGIVVVNLVDQRKIVLYRHHERSLWVCLGYTGADGHESRLGRPHLLQPNEGNRG